MRIEPVLLTPQLQKLKRDMVKAQAAEADAVGKRLCELAKTHLERTLKFWNQSGENKFPLPVIKCEYRVQSTPTRGAQVTVDVLAADPSGQPHFLWHILSQGRREYTFPEGKRSPPLKKRKARRTHGNRLDVDPFPGFTGEVFVIHGGQRVKGVPGNRWYEAARDEIRQAFAADPLLKRWKLQAFVYALRVFK